MPTHIAVMNKNKKAKSISQLTSATLSFLKAGNAQFVTACTHRCHQDETQGDYLRRQTNDLNHMKTKTTLHFGIRRGAVPGYLFEGLFTFVGIVLLGVGFFLSINSHVFMNSAAPAEAVILTMHSAGDGRPGTPLVEYVADGRRYVERLDTGTSEMMPGRHITVHYNRHNPRDVRYTKDDGWLIMLSVVAGIAFTGMGAVARFVKRQRQVRRTEAVRQAVGTNLHR